MTNGTSAFGTFILTASLLVFSTGLSVAKDGDLIWLDYPEEGAVLGQGYDLLSGRVTYGTCVDFVPIQDPSQSVDYSLEEVTSLTEVASKTHISASGSLKMALVNASARLSFLSQENFSLSTTKFLLSATVRNSALFAAPSLDFKAGGLIAPPSGSKVDKAADYPKDYEKRSAVTFKNDDTPDDIDKCGQGFVAAIVSGAAVDAFLTMSKKNASSLADIKGGLEADIGSVFKVSGSFAQQQSSRSIQDSTSISMFRYGGGVGSVAYDLNGLKQGLDQLLTDASSIPMPVHIAVLPYSRIAGNKQPGSYGAGTFTDAVSAYFLSKDVTSRTEDALRISKDYVENYPEEKSAGAAAPIAMARVSDEYVSLNSAALKLSNKLSVMLNLCSDQVADSNRKTAETLRANPDLASPGTDPLQTQIPENVRISNLRLVMQSAFGLPSADFERQNLQSGSPFVSTGSSDQIKILEDKINSSFESAKLILVGTSNSSPESKVDACATITTSTNKAPFFALAPQLAVGYVSRELALRPTFWTELGLAEKYSIKRRIEAAKTKNEDGTLQEATSDKMQEIILDVLKTHNRLYRATALRRDTCRLNYSHPLCSASDDWIDGAITSMDLERLNIVVTQVLAEVANLK